MFNLLCSELALKALKDLPEIVPVTGARHRHSSVAGT